MKMTCAQKELSKYLLLCDQFAKRNPPPNTEPGDEYTVLLVVDEQCVLAVRSSQSMIVLRAPADVKEPGETAVMCHTLADLVKAMGDGEDITLSGDFDKGLTIQRGKANKSKMRAAGSKEIGIRGFLADDDHVTIDSEELLKTVLAVSPSICPSEERANLHCLHLSVAGGKAVIEATTGYTMAHCECAVDNPQNLSLDICLPPENVVLLVKTLAWIDASPVRICQLDNQVLFSGNGWQFASSVLAVEFPNLSEYMKLPSAKNRGAIEIQSVELKSLIAPAMVMGRRFNSETIDGVFKFSGNALSVSAKSEDGDAVVDTDLPAGMEYSIAFDLKRVKATLAQAGTGPLKLTFDKASSKRPVVIQKDAATFVLMPLEMGK